MANQIGFSHFWLEQVILILIFPFYLLDFSNSLPLQLIEHNILYILPQFSE